MFHYLTLSEVDPRSNTVFKELSALDTLRVFSNRLAFPQSNRLLMILCGWPRMVWNAVGLVRQSRAESTADTVVIFDSHLIFLVWLAVRGFSYDRGQQPFLVLPGVIYTPRHGTFQHWFKKRYYSFLLRRLDLVTCYSRTEQQDIESIAGGKPTVYAIKYGIGEGPVIAEWHKQIEHTSTLDQAEGQHQVKVLTAGRSSRDYETLIKAFASPHLNTRGRISLDIICDNHDAAPDHFASDMVTIHRSAHGRRYVEKLLQADIVVVPLSNLYISAGQMVFLHALAAGKPLIVTDTPTVREYLKPGVWCRLVPIGDPDAMAHALSQMAARMPLAKPDVDRQRKLYEEAYSDTAFARRFAQTLLMILHRDTHSIGQDQQSA